MKAFLTYLLNEVKNKQVPKATAMELMRHLHNSYLALDKVDVLHHLLHKNTSTLSEQRFSSDFSGTEFFLKDHIVQGKKVLPGAAYLEMAWAAANYTLSDTQEEQIALRLKNVAWASPLTIVDDQPARVHISLLPGNSGLISYEIYSEEAGKKDFLVHSQGSIELASPADAPIIDLNALQATCNSPISVEECYQAFKQIGLLYGSSHRGIEQLYVGHEQVLAKVSLPDCVKHTQEHFALHPSLLDSALQASIGLFLRTEAAAIKPALPFALDTIEVFAPYAASAWVWIRYSKDNKATGKVQKLDLDLFDDTGKVCIRLQGFSSRLLNAEEKETVIESISSNPYVASALNQALANPSLQDTQEVIIEEELIRKKASQYLKKLLSSVSKLPLERISEEAPLEDYGIDSVMVMKLTKQLEATFGSLSKTLFYEYQTIEELTNYFLEEYRTQLCHLLGLQEEKTQVLTEKTKVSIPEVTITGKRRLHRLSPAHTKLPSEFSKTNGSLDIAIIGVAGRYPQARNLQEFWANLSQGTNCITEIPGNRWDHSRYFDTDKNKAGKTYSKWGGFIDGVDQFDPLFFNISPSEAEALDPQERLFLQCVYETIEDAGYTRTKLGSKVGIYAGVMYVEYPLYGIEQTWQGKPMVLSGSPASIANRVSYFFNFNGPSLAVDTMCSSSLTTIHLACQSIRQGECEVAIAGGVNVSIHPNKYLILAHGKFASSKGLCESFGQGGDGYVPGEGVGAVLLKPLDKAIADGDHIYGVIKGTTVNHGGKTNGYTVPNPNAQAEVVASTLKEAGIDPRAVSYIEAHGTGTALGDPIEVTGLTKAFGEYTSEKGFCALGSVKSNIGHCEGAAGIAGVTKVLLQMKHGQLAPSLHAKELNINIDFENTPFKVQQELTEWKRPLISANGQTREYPRIAGVSSFGAGGANAHILIQEYIPVTPPVSIPVTAQQPAIIVLSAKNAERLNEQAQQLLNFIKENPVAEQVLSNIAYTLQVGREAMDERLALVVESVEQLQDKLQAFLQEQEDVEGLYRGQVKRSKETLSIFTGDEDLQQAIYAWMSKGKYGKLLELWVKGLVLDWDKLYTTNKPHRISLPTYPFARDRYWAPEAATSASNTSVQSVLHPLVHQNTSDFTVQRFSSTFTGQEFFLTDHVVNGQKMLPGVAYLEMAQAAIRKAISAKEEYTLGLKLKNVVWNQPFVVSEQAEQLHIRLSLEENAQVTYEIYSEAKSDQSVLFCQGRTELTNTIDSAFLDLDSLQKECNQRTFSALQCYEAFQQMGLRYGASHQGLQMVYASADQVLAKLALPASVTATQQTFVLHPSLLDSALQASIGLMMYRNELQPALPFAVQEVEIIDSCTSSMWAWVRYSEGSQAGDKVQKLDIDVCNEQGKVCVRIKQFSVRVLTVAAESKASQKVIDTLLLAPKWTSQDASIPTDDVSYAKQVVVLCELDQTLGQTIEAYYTYTQCLVFSTVEQNIYTRFEMYATALFKQIQSLIQGKPKGKILVQVVVPVQAEKQLLAGLAGMLKTAQQEHPKFVGQLIEIEELDAVSILTRLNNDSLYPSVSHIRYQGGRRLVCTWTQVQPATTVTMPWKEEGVYLITGGLGGLGALFANEIARRAKRPTLILTGRSLLNSAKRAQLEALDALGATVRYVPLDIANSQAVSNLMHSIEQEFGRLDGVLHSAGIIQDSFILKKTTQQVEEVLAPKVAGLVNLDQASKHFNLDFLILFSSVAGAIGSAGQADYATGNAFMDAYANYRNALVASGQRQGHTLSINWPLWKEGGMQVNQATEQLLWQNMGMVAMPTATGIQAFYQAFNSRKDQVMVLAGDGGQLKQFMKLETGLQGGYDLVEKELTVDYDEFYQAILEKIAKGELSEDEFEKVVTQ